MDRVYRTAEARSLPYGRRVVEGPKRDWRGRSAWKPRSRPAKPIFAKPRADCRNKRFTVRWLTDFANLPWSAAKVREGREWLARYGLRRKLANAARSTRIRREVAQRLAIRRVLKGSRP